jgi:hypothetical protein
VGLLDATEPHAPSKARRYVISGIVLVLLVGGGLWWMLRYHAEKVAVYHFLSAVVAGDMQKAYSLWSPSESYSLRDFQSDWGTEGYYGPVKSFNVAGTYRPPSGSSGVVVIVDVSPYAPFPEKDDAMKQSKTKEVRLWVQFSNHAVQYPPPQFDHP